MRFVLTTDIAVAWEVVSAVYEIEKQKAASNGMDVGNIGLDLFHDLQSCEARFRNYSDYKTSEVGETAPHAICLAALKAVGVEL